ncbi:MAG: HAD hydrolase-like protein [Parcubacteria group bacterium]|jgi:FMN phosphatase YigB (HAD superfamily)
MIIFIDFDDVLFNTKQFVADIRSIFEKNGVSEETFKKYYRYFEVKKGEKIVRKYNPYKQIERIKAQGFETGKIEKEFAKLISDTSEYIFSDGIEFLDEVKNEDLYVVSFGDRKFQKEKINNSGIAKYFKKISVVDFSKAVEIKKILKNKKVKKGEGLIFIDDREKFLKDIKKSYPGMVTFLLKIPEGRYDDEITNYCDFEVRSFNEILEIIEPVSV